MFYRVCKIDDEQQIVTGEVYAPNVIDSHGDMMLPVDVEKLCHRFMRDVELAKSIDDTHDEQPTPCYPVECFVARNMPDYSEGAWVLSVKVDDAALWGRIKAGELNGFSFQALVFRQPALAEIVTYPESIGEVEENNSHTHFFFAEIDSNGKVRAGRTSVTKGHFHEIKGGTATEIADGHAHRYFL